MTPAATLVRLVVIGLVMLVVFCLFLYVGGWFSPHRLTQDRIMAAFQNISGPQPGFRRNHAKGVCVSGWFESSGAAASLSKAAVFQPGRVPVVGRISLAGPMPAQADTPGQVRAMGVQFLPPGGGEWRIAMINIPVFVVNSPQGFYDQLVASTPDSATGKPNPEAMKAFLARHPESVRALALVGARTISSGFADATYNGLNAFRFVSASGVVTPVRWAMEPAQAVAAETPAQATQSDKNYLFDALIAQIQQHPLQWHLVITLGQPGDPTNDPTLPWPADRRHIDAGTMTVDAVSSEDGGGACSYINYDPLVLPAGIEASDDPILSARSAAYSRSFTLRAEEKARKAPSAVTPQEVRAGGKS
jgi:catalase